MSTFTQQTTQREYKPAVVHDITEEETKEITKEQIQYLMLTPDEPNSYWMPIIGSKGQTYYTIMTSKLNEFAPNFVKMLFALKNTTYTHLGFGGFKFQFIENESKVIKTEYAPKKPWGSGNKYAPKPAEYISEVQVFSDPHTLNEFLADPANRNQWKILGTPAVNAEGEPTILIAKYTTR